MSNNILIPLLPLAGSMVAGLFGRYIGIGLSKLVTTGSILAALALSIMAFLRVAVHDGPTEHDLVFSWIVSGDFKVSFGVLIDELTAVMLIVVNGVSAVVHLYSWGYMHEDPHNPRFFSYLSFFTFSMLVLVVGDNFLQLYMGWEGVGVASYLLIGFWFYKESACDAAMKAFLVNRVGDFGFGLGIFAVFLIFGTVDYAQVFELAAAGKYPATLDFLWGNPETMTLTCLLLFMGAMGKSAQLGLHTWLPDAMEGPTPVSALIHAATMVTAGVFMVCRLSPLFELSETALAVVTLVGAGTAFMAATIGLVQNDIKRVIAYSTMSQLGYMFFGAGVSAYAASMFHLMTHAFFKALLFLGSGAVIIAMHHEQDMRNMGGLRKKLPITYAYMMLGSLALVGFGIPGVGGLAGFYSKDAILESAYAAHTTVGSIAFTLGILAAFMTTFYSFRLLFLTFHGEPRQQVDPPVHQSAPIYDAPVGHGHHDHGPAAHGHDHGPAAHGHDHGHDDHGHDHGHDDHGHDHGHDDHGHGDHGGLPHEHASERPWYMKAMLFPLVFLAIGSVIAGFVGHPMIEAGWFGASLFIAQGHDALVHAHHVPLWVKWSPFVMFLLGLGLAWLFYLKSPELPGKLAAFFSRSHRFLLSAWYFDKMYDRLFVQMARKIGDGLWKTGDAAIIDDYGVNGVARGVQWLAAWLKSVQSGYVYHYAFAMAIGLLVLVTFYP